MLQYYESEEPESFIEPLLNKKPNWELHHRLWNLGAIFFSVYYDKEASIELVPSKNNDTHQPIRAVPGNKEIAGIGSLFADQVVLATTLEYVCCHQIATLMYCQSSYTRLGLSLNTRYNWGYPEAVYL
uniref:hypothetical protein n=1 Tax=Salmonella sp. TaxID=599 RepID=UPI001CD96E7D|nr:hypothetical protein [Salmonella sp.]